MSEYVQINPSEYSERAYLDYTMAVVQDRSIPSLKDGQKPVHRRILFAMHELYLRHDKDMKKCARIVGDIIGKYHPHGDTAAYEALVKMSQDFYLRYPLVHGQGNFGSRDKDPSAAMRYTEAKLHPISQLLLSEIDMGSVDYINNYDYSLKEPEVLPSRLNFLLMNGVFGIAVGLSTEIPSHNIRNVTDATVHYIKNKDCTISELVEYLKAPDYPTGGQIINKKEEIIKNYEDGNGFFTVRCRWKIEKLANKQWQIIIYELPPSMSASSLAEKIGDIKNPKVDKKDKKKKDVQKMLNDKQFLSNLISNERDESNEEEGIRFVLEPRSMRENPEDIMNSLYKLLGLEENVKMNMVSIGLNNKACGKNLKDMISEWVEFRIITLEKRTKFSLNKSLERKHILEGREIAYNNINKIIEIIKTSEKPKESLIKEFNLTEIQAEDILEIKLRQLMNLELGKIKEEILKLQKEIFELESLLNSDKKMNNLLIKEMESDTKLFEDERRTLIEESNKAVLSATDTIADEKMTIIITKQGWMTSRKGHNVEIETIQLKDGDSIFKIIEGRSIQPIALLSNDGRMFNIKPTQVANGKNMNHINTLVEMNGCQVVDMLFIEKDLKHLIANKEGYGFITDSDNLLTKNKAGKSFFTVDKKFEIFNMDIVNKFKYITWFTSDNRILCYDINEIKELPKGKGVQLMKLPKNIKISGYLLHNEENIKITTKKGEEIISIVDSGILGKRPLRGIHIKDSIINVMEDLIIDEIDEVNELNEIED